jgi:hypothetical protein
MNRLTITLDDDLYAMARAYAVCHRKSLSKSIGDLLRRGQAAAAAGSAPSSASSPASRQHPETGFPLIELDAGLTMADIQRAIDDEDARHLEAMGLSPGEIERTLDR